MLALPNGGENRAGSAWRRREPRWLCLAEERTALALPNGGENRAGSAWRRRESCWLCLAEERIVLTLRGCDGGEGVIKITKHQSN